MTWDRVREGERALSSRHLRQPTCHTAWGEPCLFRPQNYVHISICSFAETPLKARQNVVLG